MIVDIESGSSPRGDIVYVTTEMTSEEITNRIVKALEYDSGMVGVVIDTQIPAATFEVLLEHGFRDDEIMWVGDYQAHIIERKFSHGPQRIDMMPGMADFHREIAQKIARDFAPESQEPRQWVRMNQTKHRPPRKRR